MCACLGGGPHTRKSAHVCHETGDMTGADFSVVWPGGSSLHSACVLDVGWLCVACLVCVVCLFCGLGCGVSCVRGVVCLVCVVCLFCGGGVGVVCSWCACACVLCACLCFLCLSLSVLRVFVCVCVSACVFLCVGVSVTIYGHSPGLPPRNGCRLGGPYVFFYCNLFSRQKKKLI